MAGPAGPNRLSATRMLAISLLAAAALAFLAILTDVRFNAPDELWFDGVSDIANRKGMTVLALAGEAIALAAMLLFLLIRAPAQPVDDAWVSTGGVRVGGNDTQLQIGCPGCGTVFQKPLTDVDEPHEQEFRCPNCGRAGRLSTEARKQVELRQATCVACGQSFTSYRDTSECPHCHAVQ